MEKHLQEWGKRTWVKPRKRVRAHANQAMPGITGYANIQVASTVLGSQYAGGLKEVSKRIGRKWELFIPDVTLLCGLVLYLQTLGKMTAAKDDVLRWLSYRRRLGRWERRLERLADMGFLLRVWHHHGRLEKRGYGYALSELGGRVIQDIDQEYNNVIAWLAVNRKKTDVVLYLDRAKEQLRGGQEVILTAEQLAGLRALQGK